MTPSNLIEAVDNAFAEKWRETNGGCDAWSAKFWFEEGVKCARQQAEPVNEAVVSWVSGTSFSDIRPQKPVSAEVGAMTINGRFVMRNGPSADAKSATKELLRLMAKWKEGYAYSDNCEKAVANAIAAMGDG